MVTFHLCDSVSSLLILKQPDSPEWSVSPYRGSGSTPTLASSLLFIVLLFAEWRGHISALVALVGQVLVEGHGGSWLADGSPPRRHVILTDVWHLPVGGAVGLWVTAAACREEGGRDLTSLLTVSWTFYVHHREITAANLFRIKTIIIINNIIIDEISRFFSLFRDVVK